MAKMKKMTKVRLSVIGLLIVAVLLAFVNFPIIYDRPIEAINNKLGTEFPKMKEIPFVLGLDLQGGTHLVYEADTSKIPFGEKGDSVEGVRDVIERRVNAFGVAEPLVQINKAKGSYRVIVELAGVKDVREAIKMIGETPLLEFKEQNQEPPRDLTNEEQKELDEFNKVAREKADKALTAARGEQDFAEVVREYSDNEIDKETGGDMGWVSSAGEFVPLYEAATQIEVGQVASDLIQTYDGLNVIKVNDKRENGEEVKARHLLVCYQGADRCETDTTKDEAFQIINDLKERASTETFVELVKENSTEPNSENSGGDLGWFVRGQMVPEFEEVVFDMESNTISGVVETQFGYHLIYKEDQRPVTEYKLSRIYIKTKNAFDILPPQDPWKNTGLTGAQLKNSRVEFDPNTTAAQVGLEFNDEGKKLFAEITERNIGKPVAIYLDGQPISVPVVNEAIKEGRAVITGDFDINEAKTLSRRLNAGALPVPINLISQQTVGASLGLESLQKSLFAGIVGLIIVALFMLIYYRLPGLIAVIALLIYGVLVLFMFKLIPVTLTLAGIAGFILSIGMAVDANVLIFERLKEELRVGKPLGTAIDEGFKRAWASIRDGNVSTLITCLILAWFGTSMIKGFAITLGVGVLISMFSAIVITRLFLHLFVNPEKLEKRLWLFGVRKKK